MSTATIPKTGSVFISKVDPDSDLMWLHIAGEGSDETYTSGASFCFNRRTGEFFSASADGAIDPAEHDLIWEPKE